MAGMLCDIAEDPRKGPLYTSGLFMSSAFVGAVTSYFIKEELKRLRPKGDGTFDASG